MNEPDPQPDPSPNRPSNGRAPDGRFALGNRGGPGNPAAAEASKRRAEFWKAIKAKDIREAVETIRQIMNDKEARPADRLAAAKELLDRAVGAPVLADAIERVELLEERFQRSQERV